MLIDDRENVNVSLSFPQELYELLMSRSKYTTSFPLPTLSNKEIEIVNVGRRSFCYCRVDCPSTI